MSSNTTTRRRQEDARRALVTGGPQTRPAWGDRVRLDGEWVARLSVDLGPVRSIEPTTALRLAAAAAIHRDGRDLDIAPPEDPEVRLHLEQVGLGGLIGGTGAPGGGKVLLPVTRLRAEGDVDEVGEGLERALAELPEDLAAGSSQLMHAFSELGTNACTHGRSVHGAFTMMQRTGADGVVLAVGDLGVGIPKHLARRIHDRATARESTWILRALRQGASGEGEDRGDGLARIVSAIDSAAGPEGELRIWSGAGRVRVSGPGRSINDWMVDSDTRGTWAEFVLTS